MDLHLLGLSPSQSLLLLETDLISYLIFIAKILFLKHIDFISPVFFALKSMKLANLKYFFLFLQSPVLHLQFLDIDHQIFNSNLKSIVSASRFMDLCHPRLMIPQLNRCHLQYIEFLRQPRIYPCSLVFENLQLSE